MLDFCYSSKQTQTESEIHMFENTIKADYNVDRFKFLPSTAAVVLHADNGDTLVIPEPVQGWNKTDGTVTIQSRRAVNSVNYYPGDWSGYTLDYKS